MKRSNRLILLIGVFLAIVAFVGIVLLLGGGGGPKENGQPEVTQVTVVQATVDIPIGTIVTDSMVRDVKVGTTEAPANRVTLKGLAIGSVARRTIFANQVLLTSDFTGTGAATDVVVPPGKRAIALQVDQVTGVGTLIKPGDYVDVVVALDFQVVTINPDDQSITVVQGIDGKSVKMVLQSMLVLQTLLPPAPTTAEGAPAASPGTALTGQQELVIVAGTANQMEVLKFSQQGTASVSLVLRSAADFQERDADGNVIIPVDEITDGIVLKSLIDKYGVLTPQIVEAIVPTPAP